MDSVNMNGVKENVTFYDLIQDENFVDISHHFLSDIFSTKNEQETVCDHDDFKDNDSDTDDYESNRVYTLADKKNFRYKCAKCDLEFTDEKAVIEHVDSHERTLQKYRCEDCSKEYLSKESLRQHRHAEHRKTFVCRYCNKTLSSDAILKSHEAKHLTAALRQQEKMVTVNKSQQQKTTFSCPHCSKLLSSKTNLESHLTRHTGDKKFKCNICDKGFTTKSGLQCHESIHKDDKPFYCTLCAKSFNTKQGFRYHNNLHLKAKAVTEDRSLSCPICYKSYVSLKSFQRHIKIHLEQEEQQQQHQQQHQQYTTNGFNGQIS